MSWRRAAAAALLVAAILARAAQTSATLTCKCGSNYLPETALAHCNRTTASCQGATCALAATLTGGGFVQLEWFCFSGAPESAFVTESFCHGVNVAPRDRFAYLCCSNYSMCNAELNATFVSTVHPTSSYQFLPDPTQLSSISNATPPHYVIPTAIASSLVISLPILLTLTLILIRARRRNTAIDDVAMDTMSSGSGFGEPYLVLRTFSRKIDLKDICLGQGSFGKISLGSYQKDSVAVKRFSSTGRDSWLHETLVFDLCMHHDAIVGFVASDTYSVGGCNEYWLVTCYHPYGSLYDFLRTCEERGGGGGGGGEEGGGRGGRADGRTLSLVDLLRMASTAYSGLAHLHSPLVGYKGKPPIAHRDVKSANILVKNNLTCCLADMGLAFVEEKESPPTTLPPSLARYDLGTRRYLSPETLCAQRCTPTSNHRLVQHYIRSDVYSMSLVIWEMCRRTVTGGGDCDLCAVPYEDMVPSNPSVEDMRKVVCSSMRPPISERWNSEPVLARVVDLMQEGWRDNPHARPSSIYFKYALLKMSNTTDNLKEASIS